VNAITSAIQSVPPGAAYAIIAALVFGEAAIFIGFVLPGETAVLLGGFLASTQHLSIWVVCPLVVVAAIIGDTVGYEVGKHFGPRLMRTRFLVRHEVRIDKARDMLSRRGGPAVFLGRFTAFFRAVMPGLAGLSQMRYRRFLTWNALGAMAWGVTYSLIGYFAGTSYETVAATMGKGAAIVIAVLVVGVLVWWLVRRRQRERNEEQTLDETGA
jgi:membrane-associated protein